MNLKTKLRSNVVRKILTERNLQQKWLMDKLGTSSGYLSQLMNGRRNRDERWRDARRRINNAVGPDKGKAIQELLKESGLSLGDAVCNLVREYLPGKPSEDQVRHLAANLSWTIGVTPETFFALWIERLTRA